MNTLGRMIWLALAGLSAVVADPDLPAQKQLCFPATAPAEFRQADVILWTDAPLDSQALLPQLVASQRYLQELLPANSPAAATGPPSRPIAIAVTRSQADFDRLWLRVAAYYGGSFGRIPTQAYSYRVFCATWFGDEVQFRQRQSVLCHELAHVWLWERLGLANDGNWLSEGIASAVQLHFHPQAGDRRQYARDVGDGHMLPLKRLMDAPRIEPKDYWQAGTLVEMLLDGHPAALPAVVEAFVRGDSASQIVQDVLHTDFVTLEKRWLAKVASDGAATQPAGR